MLRNESYSSLSYKSRGEEVVPDDAFQGSKGCLQRRMKVSPLLKGKQKGLWGCLHEQTLHKTTVTPKTSPGLQILHRT